MRECFWSIYKFRTYIQLGKNYTLYVVRKNKEGQWIEKKIINFLRLRKGKFLFWRYDNKGNPYFSYEHITDKWVFYFGYTGLETLHNYDKFYPRLEAALRKRK